LLLEKLGLPHEFCFEPRIGVVARGVIQEDKEPPNRFPTEDERCMSIASPCPLPELFVSSLDCPKTLVTTGFLDPKSFILKAVRKLGELAHSFNLFSLTLIDVLLSAKLALYGEGS